MPVQTFTWTPFRTPKIQENFNVLTSTFENGTTQKRLKGRKPTVWTLSFKTTYAEMMAIKDFFIARKGSYEPFNWGDPYSGTTKLVRFKEDKFEAETQWQRNGIFDVVLEEVI